MIAEFEDRCKDVREYYTLLEFLDSIATNKNKLLESESYEGNTISYQPKRECQKILRANFYLLLYNLVESTTNLIITAFKDTINDEHVPMERLTTRIINLHIDGLFKDVTSPNRISTIGKDIYQNTIKKGFVMLDKLGFNTSGNVDYDYFQKIVGNIGCRGKVDIDESRVKQAMGRTKDYRNKLAHGVRSFSDIGSNHTLSEIKDDYNSIEDFLRQSLYNFKYFLDDKRYLQPEECKQSI